jgi:hypothetical protein
MQVVRSLFGVETNIVKSEVIKPVVYGGTVQMIDIRTTTGAVSPTRTSGLLALHALCCHVRWPGCQGAVEYFADTERRVGQTRVLDNDV